MTHRPRRLWRFRQLDIIEGFALALGFASLVWALIALALWWLL